MERACSRCGTVAEAPDDGAPEGWSFAVENRRMTYQCPDCTRANIRAIEGKLPEEWWE
jgi:DNA-directed RNA polymerase subunit RPC12/RpoP